MEEGEASGTAPPLVRALLPRRPRRGLRRRGATPSASSSLANSLSRPSSPPSRACATGHVLPSVPRAYRVHGAAESWCMSTSASTNCVRSEATAGEVRAGRRESKEKQHRREEETVTTWRRCRAPPRFAGSSLDPG
jgi:hypothetical protein